MPGCLIPAAGAFSPLPIPSADPHPLFVVDPAPGSGGQPQVVRSWNEAHALHGSARPSDVAPAYVAALIGNNHNAAISPYRRIRRLPRAHHVLIGSVGELHTSPYDPLAGGAASMDADTLHLFLRQGLIDHLHRALQGHGGAIGCEHSSGLDSNAVLGALVHGLGLPPERLYTWSQEGGGEGPPLEQFRPFHGLLAEHCHRFTPADHAAPTANPGQVDSLAVANAQLSQQLAVFGAPPQIGGNPQAVALMAEQACTLLFSGFGGDQALSHNAANVPTDLVAQGRWAELVRWSGSRRQALKTGGGRMLALSHRPWATSKVHRRTRDFCRSDVLERCLTAEGRAWLAPHLKNAYPWEIDNYLPQHHSIRQRVLADWVALRAEGETRLAAAYGIAKAFPLLDERLIGTLLQQDPVLFGEGAGRGRLLHRRAFAPFLPPQLRDNPSKDREPEGGLEQWRAELLTQRLQALERQLQRLEPVHPALLRWWDLAAIRQHSERILANPDASMKDVFGTSQALAHLQTISGWWQALDG
jgi:hypothetical protein